VTIRRFPVGIWVGLALIFGAGLAQAVFALDRGALVWAVVELAAVVAGGTIVWLALRDFRSAEEERRHADERFRLLVKGVNDCAIYMIDPQGHVIEWNAGAERIKGYTAEEIIGHHFSRFYTPEDRERGVPQRALETAVKQGKYEDNAWRVRKDGTRFFASVLIDPLFDRTGRLVGFAKITRDITERTLQQEQLAQYQKMDALGQLTGGIAHDFNNLIHVMKNAAELLERRLQDISPDVRGYIDMLKRNADRAASLTQRLLAYSRRQVLDPRPINPGTLVNDLSALLKQALGEGIEIETVLGAGTWWIHADVNQLETAILNLSLNARDAMSGSGKLTIEISNAFLDEAYTAGQRDVKSGQYVMIAVSDNGEGMTPEVESKAFDPFFTTKETGQGTGLGLSQVYGFVKQSGGHAKIYSELGEGTTVKLYLPRLFGEQATQTPPKTTGRPAPDARGTILVVEDDEDVCRFTADTLSELGYRVLTARNAASALDLLGRRADIDLLFTDVGLPGGVNGRQLATEAQKRFPSLKVLFTTGYTRNAVIHHGRLDPGVDLIVKPYTHESLGEKVRQLLRTH